MTTFWTSVRIAEANFSPVIRDVAQLNTARDNRCAPTTKRLRSKNSGTRCFTDTCLSCQRHLVDFDPQDRLPPTTR